MPELGDEYARQVLAVWPEEQKRPAPASAPTALAAAWGATISRATHPFFGQGQAPRIIPLPGAAIPAIRTVEGAPPNGAAGVIQPGGVAATAAAGSPAVGRTLDAYRAMPVIWAYRPPPPPPKPA